MFIPFLKKENFFVKFACCIGVLPSPFCSIFYLWGEVLFIECVFFNSLYSPDVEEKPSS